MEFFPGLPNTGHTRKGAQSSPESQGSAHPPILVYCFVAFPSQNGTQFVPPSTEISYFVV
jgi:hypothetical protein